MPPRPLIALALVAAPAAAQAPPPPRVSDVRYTVTFDAAHAARRSLELVLRFRAAARGTVALSLPAWTPGAYEISDFARWVSRFAPSAGGRPLRWDKADMDTWRVRVEGPGEVEVRYEVRADSLDNAMAWARDDFAFFNGTTVFLHPEGQGFDWPATMEIVTERGWRVATGMRQTGAATWREATYHDLVDMPTFVGRFDLDSAQVAGRWMRLATYPEGSLAGSARAATWERLQRYVPPLAAVFGEVPWATYTILQVADPGYEGASGLEHQNSHLDVVTPAAVGHPFLDGLYAHEIAHAWNVKRLRPADLWPYRYDAPQPTPWLWVSEGITDYYADLALLRGGVVDSAAFLATTQGKIEEVANAPPVALEDASLSTWIHPTDGTGYLYYPKGSLAGLLLDIMIRDASDNRRSLDDVMRGLYRTAWKAGRGFTGAEWWAAVRQAAGGRAFDDFIACCIDGREPFPYATVLPRAGLRLVEDSTTALRLGVQSLADSAGIRVVAVVPGSMAEAAGVQADDYLVRVGEVAVRGDDFGAEYRRAYASRVGEAIPIVVQRRGQEVQLTGTVRAVVEVTRRLEVDPAASPRALRVRAGLFRGTTGD